MGQFLVVMDAMRIVSPLTFIKRLARQELSARLDAVADTNLRILQLSANKFPINQMELYFGDSLSQLGRTN